MFHYDHFVLKNGLTVYVHENPASLVAIVDVMYKVGSKDEDESMTGVAHLYEHMMFSGSRNIPDFYTNISRACGTCNAFTSSDVTNYHIVLPACNLETAFWLESDRMLGLALNHKALEIQKKIVVEEYKQVYANQPYGDVWLKLRPLTYKVHPYRWPTIGDIEHVKSVDKECLVNFGNKYYYPSNAVMVVSGNVKVEEVRFLSEKWFESIPAGETCIRKLPSEPVQNCSRILEMEAEVPADALFKAFHIPPRYDEKYYTAKLISQLLGGDESSRLHRELVIERKIFNTVSSIVTETEDHSLLIIKGFLRDGISLELAELEVMKILDLLCEGCISDNDLFKFKNKSELNYFLTKVDLLNCTSDFAQFALGGRPEFFNSELAQILSPSAEDVLNLCREIFKNDNSSTVYYSKSGGNNK